MPEKVAIRAFPSEVLFADGCRWCGRPITSGRADRTWHDGRGDDPDCRFEYLLHTNRLIQWNYIAQRDGEVCCLCGEAEMKWLAEPETFIGGRGWIDRENPLCEWVGGTSYTPVRWVSALELEHTVPLWSTTHLAPQQRRFFFGPGNLKLMCRRHHAEKTAAETETRAKEKRQAEKLGVTAGERPARPKARIQSRGFAKGPKRKISQRADPWGRR
jgi:hypothetical protein